MMKILILMGYSSVYGGNFIPSIIELTKFAEGKGDSVGYAVPEQAESRTWCKSLNNAHPVYYICQEDKRKQISKLNEYIVSNKYEVLYSHFSYFYLAAGISRINRKISIVCHKHTDINSTLTIKRMISLAYKKVFLYNNMSLIFVSKRLKRYELMDNSKSAYWIPNAIVPSRFQEDISVLREKTRNQYGIESGKIVCLMFGWNHYVKGVDIALKAIEKISDSNNVFLAIVVSNSRGKEYTLEYAKSIVDERTLKHLILLEPNEKVEEYHAMSDIFLSSSRSEGFPYSILEALYLGRPVVQSDLEGTQWSKKYETVATFASENYDECAQCILAQIKKLESYHISDALEKVSTQVANDYSIDNWVRDVYTVLLSQWHKKNQ